MAKLDELKELVHGIERNKIKNIHVIGNGNKTIFDEFYQAILENRFETDAEYSQYFYNDNSSSKAYYKLKDRLFERILNTVFFIDVNNNYQLPIEKEYYKNYKNALAIKILLGKSLRQTAISFAKKTLKKSAHYGFTDIAIELARHLQVHYGSVSISDDKYAYYSNIVQHQLKIYKVEVTIEDYLHSFYLLHKGLSPFNKKHKKKFKKHKNYILKKINKYQSYKIVLYSGLYLLNYYNLQAKWKKCLKTCDKFLDPSFIGPQYTSRNLIVCIYIRKLISFFMLREFNEFEKILDSSRKYFEVGHNWYYIQDLNIKVQYHQKNFKKGFNILEEVKKTKNLSFYFNTWEENWKIHEAFIHYLHKIGKLDLENDQAKFRLNKFLNEVPNHSKDKKGSNITILILQILFLLEDRKYDVLIDKAEALKIYTQRYLKGDGTFRSNCFIKMLLCLPAGNFERAKVEQKAQKHLDRLLSMPIEKALQSAELEIMPYEMLWEFVLESLKRNA